jgi:cobalt-zinc-cadmium efflux system protein
MKTEKNILLAFLLNLTFSLFEFLGGIFTGSVAILSDAVHDIGDAVSIDVSFFLERKAKKQPDATYTYGYARYSVLGGIITTLILLVGSLAVIYNAVNRLFHPTEIHYNGMILFAIVGVLVNFFAALLTREGNSLNQKAVNLHMLEDVLGWLIVLIGAIVMRFTDFKLIDPILSICVAIYIFIHAFSHLKEALNLFLEKTPHNIDVDEIEEHLKEIEGVLDIHHIHVWSMDGNSHYATMHVVTNRDYAAVKADIKEELHEHGIAHVTLELENENEHCQDEHCHTHSAAPHHHHHHGHHH